MHVVIFEAAGWESLAPLTLGRPTFSLMCGTSTLLEKQVRFLAPTRLTLWVRPQLADYCRRHVVPFIAAQRLGSDVRVNEPLDSQPAMLVDGSTLYLTSRNLAPDAAESHPAGLFAAVDPVTSRLRQARVNAPGLSPNDALAKSERWATLNDLPRVPPAGKSVSHVWDLLGFNEESIVADAPEWRENRCATPDGPWHLVNKDQVLMADTAKLGPGCVIDASKGPVILSAGSSIGANAVIQGPCFIGANTEITPLSLIRPGTSIGPTCKIGGEVARAIVTGYSNKPHEGYLGDSYVGEWVNLGAGTTTSNLKNTYGSITMNRGGRENGGEIDTGRKFLGSIIGDHAKTAIGTRFMSGSYLGYCSMIATSAHAPRFTPSFSFSTDKGTEPYRVQKAFEVARAMFARRNRTWTNEDEALMLYAADAARASERHS